MPAPFPKPTITTLFQSSPCSAILDSMDSARARDSNSKSCRRSRSWFSKPARSRMYQEPSITSGALMLNSAKASPAGCCVHAADNKPLCPTETDKSLSIVASVLGLSPMKTTRCSGLLKSPPSNAIGIGPSGLIAATDWAVNRRPNHSFFNLSRSSSSLRFAASSCCARRRRSCSFRCSSVEECTSSCKVGKISTTWMLSAWSAARPKASEIASSPTLYSTVSIWNLLVRMSFVMFSMTDIIFFLFAAKPCTHLAKLNPLMRPPHAARRLGET
mmetsp:Transcript_81904/g.236826  ORF Transcript_81904/g.236826 Transcript_81904/m.236826 type:complete len:273 (+) Transcript_81904:586-1404(+)